MSLVTYTASGPWTNNAPPGISAAALTAIEAFLTAGAWDTNASYDGSGNQTLNSVKASANATLAGTTAGSMTVYQPLQGTFKLAFVLFNGYENTTATEQKLSLPAAFSGPRVSYVAFGGIPLLHLYSSGSALSGKCATITGLPSGTGAGSITTNSTINGFQYGEITAGFDAVGGGSSQSQTYTATLALIGT